MRLIVVAITFVAWAALVLAVQVFVPIPLFSLVPLLVKWNAHETFPGPRASERDELLRVGEYGICATVRDADILLTTNTSQSLDIERKC